MSAAERAAEKVRRAIEWAKAESSRVADFASSMPELVVSYHGSGAIPAKIFSTIARTLSQRALAEPLPSSEAAVHVAPYRESRYGVLHFAPEPWGRSETARLCDALSVMQVPALYVVYDAEDPILSKKAPEGSLVAPPRGADALTCHVALSALSALSYALKTSPRSDARVERLSFEFSSWGDVAADLLEAYWDVLVDMVAKAREGRPLVLLFTSTLEAAALSLARPLSSLAPVAVYEASFAMSMGTPKHSEVYAVYSTAEADVLKEAYLKWGRSGVSVKLLELRTDPLSAALYGYVLSLLLPELLARLG